MLGHDRGGRWEGQVLLQRRRVPIYRRRLCWRLLIHRWRRRMICDESREAARRFVERRVARAVREAQVAAEHRAEAVAGREGELLLLKEAPREVYRVGDACAADVDDEEHARVGRVDLEVRDLGEGRADAVAARSICVADRRNRVERVAERRERGALRERRLAETLGLHHLVIRRNDVLRRDDPAEPPARHGVPLGKRVRRDGAVGHAGQHGSRRDVLFV
mmetsp:Transcript_17163/g.69049  ORF Transcript_17163/g.69049 Transcript_17163/m.69049 type:complete len:220 (+) Transcript_17163:225-884(+)